MTPLNIDPKQKQETIEKQHLEFLNYKLICENGKFQLIANKRVGKSIIWIRIDLTPDRIVVRDSDNKKSIHLRTAPRVEEIIDLYAKRSLENHYELVQEFVKQLNK